MQSDISLSIATTTSGVIVGVTKAISAHLTLYFLHSARIGIKYLQICKYHFQKPLFLPRLNQLDVQLFIGYWEIIHLTGVLKIAFSSLDFNFKILTSLRLRSG